MKSLKTTIHFFALLLVALAFTNCASTYTSNYEKAKFELDQGNYTAAITSATAAVADRPGDAAATRILANAYLGRSGIEFLFLAEGMMTLQDSSDPNFDVISTYLPDTMTSAGLDDLRTAIETLETLDGIDVASISDELLADATFDLATMQMIESFALGVYKSDFYGDFPVAMTGIEDDDRANVQDDLIDFDNRIIASGIASDEQFIAEVRQVFFILEPLSAGEGFTVSEYRALVRCQLSGEDAADVDTTAYDAGIANCADLEPDSQAADIQACYSTDTSL